MYCVSDYLKEPENGFETYEELWTYYGDEDCVFIESVDKPFSMRTDCRKHT